MTQTPKLVAGTPTYGPEPKLTQVLLREPSPDGGPDVPVTVADRIVRAVRTGAPVQVAAATVAVDRGQVYDWLRLGARALLDAEKGIPLHPYAEIYADFARRVAIAEAEAHLEDVALSQRLARGGRTSRITTTKKISGNVVEETVREEELGPDPNMVRWRLERRHSDVWGRRRLEVSGPDGGPVEVDVVDKRAALAQSLAVVGARLQDTDNDWEASIAAAQGPPLPLLPGVPHAEDVLADVAGMVTAFMGDGEADLGDAPTVVDTDATED